METRLARLGELLEGEFYQDEITRIAYATDASVYREVPLAVACPRNSADLIRLVDFARDNGVPLIPRTAGTSLAGQVVGGGLVVDVSRHLTRILEFNREQRYVWVEPGVILDELNAFLAPYGLFFGPEASTGNRCMIGGMVGNNACGLHSLVYGSTREHTLAVRAVLSDGSEALFEALDEQALRQKMTGERLENRIYRTVVDILSDPVNQREIRNGFPDPSVRRRNTGYALDLLLESIPFQEGGKHFNISTLLNGSEGTLALFSGIKLNLVDLPSKHTALICAQFASLADAVDGNTVVLRHQPAAVELMDHHILERTQNNPFFQSHRFFIEGEPKAVLITEFRAEDAAGLEEKIGAAIGSLRERGLGYAYPGVTGPEMKKVWYLRKAGLGLLSTIPGDRKPVSVIEDTAVPVARLKEYLAEMESLFRQFGMDAVYHAHIGTGELHLRPTLNLKDPADVILFREIATATALLVKKYGGSMSGEHGDGRLRGGLIPLLLGDHNYQLLRQIKSLFDPDGIFNPGKITDTPPMDHCLRATPGRATPELATHYDFSDDGGIVRAIEKCNGSGDCRKPFTMGGTMCPSYQATRDERHSTRARANVLREFIYRGTGREAFNHPEMLEILDLCLGCKACKSECPSGVDIAKIKTEYLQHWYDRHGVPFRTWLIAHLPDIYRFSWRFSSLVNRIMSYPPSATIIKKMAGFHLYRSLPAINRQPVHRWYKRNDLKIRPTREKIKGSLYLFLDEFTDYQDFSIGEKSIRLLTALGYEVRVLKGHNSARTYLSKGLLRQAKRIIRSNILRYAPLVGPGMPLIGLEPSAILGFRDEYPELAGPDLTDKAIDLGANCLMLEEFLEREMKAGRITKDQFTRNSCQILLHGHCQQKAIASTRSTLFVLGFPENYACKEIPSGCCGMAGAFGYEQEHYELSQQVGELVLFPAVREAAGGTLICAPGTSCRSHIEDGTGRRALHPAEILFEAVVKGN
ncbi:MAG: FAD-linked oxidase C-terminal domain-containing protein [Bacteroidales bacterium]